MEAKELENKIYRRFLFVWMYCWLVMLSVIAVFALGLFVNFFFIDFFTVKISMVLSILLGTYWYIDDFDRLKKKIEDKVKNRG